MSTLRRIYDQVNKYVEGIVILKKRSRWAVPVFDLIDCFSNISV